MRTRRVVALGFVVAAVGGGFGFAVADITRPAGKDPATTAGAAAPAIDPYACRLGVAARVDAIDGRHGDSVQAVQLDCAGQPTLHLPGPYGPQNVLPAGLFHVPGWQVSQLVVVEGETRVWLVDGTQSCLLRSASVTSNDPPWPAVTCNLITPQGSAAPPAPTTPDTSPSAPTAHPA